MRLKELFESEEREERSVLTVKGYVNKHFAGNFTVGSQELTSLEGSPETVNRDFSCSGNKLKTLDFAPREVGGDFYCRDNRLESLKGGPVKVGGDYACGNNKLTSLEGIASSIGENLYAANNKFKSLEGIHKHIKSMNGFADFSENPIASNVLGLMRISGLTDVDLDVEGVQIIINRHLKGDRDIFACQEELVNAGFEEYAKL